jgi:hypothetical protein
VTGADLEGLVPHPGPWAAGIRARVSSDPYVHFDGVALDPWEIASGRPGGSLEGWRGIATDLAAASSVDLLLRFVARYGPIHLPSRPGAPPRAPFLEVFESADPSDPGTHLRAIELLDELVREQAVFSRLCLLLTALREGEASAALAQLLGEIASLWRDPDRRGLLSRTDQVLRAEASWAAMVASGRRSAGLSSAAARRGSLEKAAHGVVCRVLGKFPSELVAWRDREGRWRSAEIPAYDPIAGVRPVVYHALRADYLERVAPIGAEPCPRCGAAVVGRTDKVWCGSCSERGRAAAYRDRKRRNAAEGVGGERDGAVPGRSEGRERDGSAPGVGP